MNLKLTASPEHVVLVKELQTDIDKNLEVELDPNQCCIYRVPNSIRKVNEEAYTPQLVSIGPLHHGKKGLANMEKKKRNYMKSFLERSITTEKQDNIFSFVKNNEDKIRNCYAETSDLKSDEYIMMILYDVIFIIELFIRSDEGTSDSLLSITTLRYDLTLDLELFENQLPYFVLEEIFNLASCYSSSNFMTLSQRFFETFPKMRLINLTRGTPIKHFTDWRRNTLMKMYPRSGSNNGYIKDLPCALKLHESGVKFKKIEGENKLVGFLKDKHELQLPHLEITDGLERRLRNVMALEQCHYQEDTHICNYIRLMDCLIDTDKDVDLLVGSGIISNLTGDNSSIANMFNKLCQDINLSESSYRNMCQDLKNHCDSRWNKRMATLRRVYFSDLWRGTATIAAAILLLLTFIQTICSIKQVV